MAEKQTRRSRAKHPALDPKLNLKKRQHLIDYDYLHKLSPEDLDWLNKFTDEYVNDRLDRKNLRKNLHRTKALKKDCGDRNNKRNRDVLLEQEVTGRIKYMEEIVEKTHNPENFLNLQIDLKMQGYLDEKGNPKRKKRKIRPNVSGGK